MEEKERIKKQLDNELKEFRFSKKQEVLHQLHTLTWKQKLIFIWNKEIEVPLIPVSAIFMLLFLSIGTKFFIVDNQDTSDENILVEVGGSFYWKDELERVVMNDED